MAITSKDLLAQMQAQKNGYKKKTDEELKQMAQQEFDAYYDTQRLGAQQQFERNDLALQQQKAALDYAFQKQQEAAEKEYNKVYSQADRQLLSRGMQRSSYGAQTLANIRQQQADVYMDLENQLAAKGNDIEAQRVQLGEQYAAQANQFDAAQAADELNRLRELQDQEYERGVAADKAQNDFNMQLYAAINQAERDAIEDDRWEREFAEDKRRYEESKNPTSGGGGGGGGDKQPTETPTTPPASGGWEDLVNALGGTKNKPVGTFGLLGFGSNAFRSANEAAKNAIVSPVPSKKTVYGPVNQQFIDDLNKLAAVDGSTKKFESDLLKKMKNTKPAVK